MVNQRSQEELEKHRALYLRLSVFTGIGALAIGGILIVAFILLGVAGDVVFRSFVTLVLLTLFASAAIWENYAAPNRAGWLTLTRLGLLVLTLGAGIWHTWATVTLSGFSSNYYVSGTEFIFRTFLFIATAIILQVAGLGFLILEKQIEAKTFTNGFLKVFAAGMIVLTAAMLMGAIGLTFPHIFFDIEGYWRVFTALAVASVILVIIPLLGRSLDPNAKQLRPQAPQSNIAGYQQPYLNAPTTTIQAVSTVPAGWYPTSDPAIERFWDGSTWTTYTRPTGFDDELPPTTEGKNN